MSFSLYFTQLMDLHKTKLSKLNHLYLKLCLNITKNKVYYGICECNM